MDWSYIAGYFDGEGHVSFHQGKRAQKTIGFRGITRIEKV